MKLFFMKQDAVDFMKHNMERLYTHYFQDNDNSWTEQEYGSNPFAEFMDVPDFELSDIESGTIGEVDFGNCKILYNNLRMLSESQCSDERLWAGLCNGTFYDYVRRRYQYDKKQLKKKETDASAVISRFFFSGGGRSGFYRNVLSKCWWVGRATFDKAADNHFAKLDIIGSADLTTKISDIFYSNTFSSNPVILNGICDALKFFAYRGQTLDEKTHIRAAMQYLNAVGGATLLDALSEDDISRIMITRISAILKGQAVDIDVDESEEDQLFEEIDEDLEEAEMTLQEEEDEYDEASDSDEEYEFDEDSDDEFDDEENQEDEDVEESVTENSAESQSLTWFDMPEEEDVLPAPDYITYGCWVKVLRDEDNKELDYHIPLKDDKTTKWYEIMRRMMGQQKGFRMFLSGKHYVVTDFGWE